MCSGKKEILFLPKWVFYSKFKVEKYINHSTRKIKIYMIVCKCSKDILSFKDMID